jgi:hypothetical protein
MLCRYGETGFIAGFPVLSPATKGSVINTEQSVYCFCSIATIEVVANDLLFKYSHVFFSTRRNTKPLLIGCPTFGVQFTEGGFL